MNKEQFIRILRKYLKGNATGEEKRFIESYYSIFEGEPELEAWLNSEKGERVKEGVLEKIWQKVGEDRLSVGVASKKKILPMFVKVAAAIVVLLISTFLVYRISVHRVKNPQNLAESVSQRPEDDIRPGGNHAVLTLANGKQIILDHLKNGSLGQQGSTKIIKISSGLLSYNYSRHERKASADNNHPSEVVYNTISTPKGGKYQVVLPDGSKVWLNAASSLRFPVTFPGNTRTVTVSGEAYFEVASLPEKPFVVQAGKLEVEVLGTHFNIDAYNNENAIKTTLIEGEVKVTEGNRSLLLQPGEQANLDKETQSLRAKKVNIEEALAWKKDLFYFDNTNIKNIMQEIARWYDVQVFYETKDLSDKNYSGIMSRYSNVEAILKRMELTGTVHFKVKGRTITVTN